MYTSTGSSELCHRGQVGLRQQVTIHLAEGGAIQNSFSRCRLRPVSLAERRVGIARSSSSKTGANFHVWLSRGSKAAGPTESVRPNTSSCHQVFNLLFNFDSIVASPPRSQLVKRMTIPIALLKGKCSRFAVNHWCVHMLQGLLKFCSVTAFGKKIRIFI